MSSTSPASASRASATPASATGGELRRELGLAGLCFYGIGGMLGGGIYALVGNVAGQAHAWGFVSFLIAMAVAAPTAWVYAGLAARHPRSGGEAWYCQLAFGGRAVPSLVGWAVLFSGVVSMAALTRAFAGYARDVAPAAPAWVLVVGFLLALTGLNLRGIRTASTANVVCTLVEAGGLVLVLVVGALALSGPAPAAAPFAAETAAAETAVPWTGLLSGAAIAFYAFIGFEDMVNVAEEVRRPERSYRIAIPLALVLVGLLYALVVFVATRVVPPEELARSEAPLARVVTRGPGAVPSWVLSAVALFAVANTALLNFVMASRLAYGMGREGLLPAWLDSVHPDRRTPQRAVLAVLVPALILALFGTVGRLAGATSFLLLLVFASVNLAALKLGRQRHGGWARAKNVPPLLGLVASLALVPFVERDAFLTGAACLVLGLLALLVQRSGLARHRLGNRR